MESSWTRRWTQVPCIAKQILKHCASASKFLWHAFNCMRSATEFNLRRQTSLLRGSDSSPRVYPCDGWGNIRLHRFPTFCLLRSRILPVWGPRTCSHGLEDWPCVWRPHTWEVSMASRTGCLEASPTPRQVLTVTQRICLIKLSSSIAGS